MAMEAGLLSSHQRAHHSINAPAGTAFERRAPKTTGEGLAPKKQRLQCLDAVRGLNVMLMVFVDNFNDKGFGNHGWPKIDHSPWDGVHLADFVMPLFLFMVRCCRPWLMPLRCHGATVVLLLLHGRFYSRGPGSFDTWLPPVSTTRWACRWHFR